jgi:hypothetical protein
MPDRYRPESDSIASRPGSDTKKREKDAKEKNNAPATPEIEKPFNAQPTQ